MQTHDTYHRAVTLADLPTEDRRALIDAVSEHVEDADAVRLAESPNGGAELRLTDPIPTAQKPAITDAIERHLEYSLSSTERVVLDQRVGWPECCYELCLDYR